MTALPVRLALRRPLKQIRHVRAVPPNRADGLVKAVYAQLERDFGLLAPPVALHSSSPAVLAASWAMLRESLVAGGVASRADKEIVAAAVSQANACPYCVEVHGMALRTLGHDEVAGPIAVWARGEPVDLGLTVQEVSELIGVAVTFHYLNRVVNVFLGPSPLPDFVPGSARDTVRAVLGKVLRPRDCVPGESLDLLPEADVPEDFAWARDTVAVAFARAAGAIDTNAIGPRVRGVVLQTLAEWDFSAPGLSRAWSHEAVSGLPEADRPAARLALLTALASSQVDERDVAEFREADGGGDAAVVELVSWASLAAARRWGVRLAGSTGARTTTRRTDA